MPRTATIAAVLSTAAALGATSASAQTPASGLRVHAIFSGGQTANFHAGQVLIADVPRARGRITQVCWSPAPIARPACSRSRLAALQPGPNTVRVTLADGTTLTRTFTAHRPGTRVGGRFAVPATIRCGSVTLFGNYDRRAGRSLAPLATFVRGARVALYNRIAPGKILMWDYATNKGGFASERCASPGLGA
ncbi:MAG TPA: hypothetical protein VHF51_15935 [Solirubrobacteraceae bacterium]|nr:hypothetical protein [Solirubrobacteraceae bacterium]